MVKFLERAITAEHLWPREQLLLRLRARGHFRRVGTVLELHDPRVNHSCFYAAFDGDHLMGWLWLTRRPGWVAWEVAQVWIYPFYRGCGLSRRFYRAAIIHDRVLLMSGCSHTKYSMALWRRFIRERSFDIWAQDLLRPADRCQVYWDNDAEEVACELPLYTQAKPRRDVRLLAVAKKGSK